MIEITNSKKSIKFCVSKKMIKKLILASTIAFFSFETIAGTWDHYALPPEDHAYENKVEDSKLSNNTEYCYHFTWMGAKFNNRTFKDIRNKTCNQYFRDKKVLCINPMVATYTGNEPDINYILQHHTLAGTCRVSQGQVCVKYTVSNNGITSYQTRYCSVVHIEMEGLMQKGCITEKNGKEEIEVCVCKSQPGAKGICNLAFRPVAVSFIPYLLYVLIIR